MTQNALSPDPPTVSNEHQAGGSRGLAVHQVKGERPLVCDLQGVHEHLDDAGLLVEVHWVFLETKQMHILYNS